LAPVDTKDFKASGSSMTSLIAMDVADAWEMYMHLHERLALHVPVGWHGFVFHEGCPLLVLH